MLPYVFLRLSTLKLSRALFFFSLSKKKL